VSVRRAVPIDELRPSASALPKNSVFSMSREKTFLKVDRHQCAMSFAHVLCDVVGDNFANRCVLPRALG
jgi:hypothetical protein